jgi:dolichyl-phosphate beta-glucosyltransferase
VSDPQVTLVVPAFNEARRLADGFARLEPVIERLGADQVEVVVVDDGSTDDTRGAIARVYGHLTHLRVVVQPQNRGKGAAVRLGIGAARGRSVVVADADMSIRPEHIPEMLSALERAEIAPGSRVVEGHVTYDSLVRTLSGRVFNRLVRHYAHTALRDTQCGCKAFRLGPARVIALLGFLERFAYDAEVFYLAGRLGLSVEPVPVTWDHVVGSSLRVGHDSLQMLSDLRSLPRTRYLNPVVEIGADVELARVREAARDARLFGLAMARGESDSLVVLAREGAVGGVALAEALGGRLTSAGPEALRGRELIAI